MSFASTLRPVGLSFNAPLQSGTLDSATIGLPFQHEPNYLQLQRMLSHYQNLILVGSSGGSQESASAHELAPLQCQVRAELYSPLPYHRTKWLHSVESARNLLLALERRAQNLKSPRAKKEALRDLTSKRQVIKRLKHRIEEIGREVEGLGERAWENRTQDDQLLGERAEVVLAKLGLRLSPAIGGDVADEELREGKPVMDVSEEDPQSEQGADIERDALLSPSLRRRQGQAKDTKDDTGSTVKGTTSGFSNLGQTEKSLQSHAREHEDLTSALVSMAAQLKQQSRAFQFSLTQDETFLNGAMEGLDLNITSMGAASKNMAVLRRMSEEQGWLGRLKLYGIILGMWVSAFLLVFAGPKLRF